MYHRSLLRLGVSLLLAAGLLAPSLVAPDPVAADGCYTWQRTLRRGMSGDDVRRLQIRVAGWAAYHDYIRIDGAFGPRTEAAVKRFQRAYGLTVDGIAGAQTYRKIYQLQDGDCTPIHFAYSEFRSCQGGFTGGAVGAAKVRANLLRVMWQLEALRKKLGGVPITIASGFRSYACNTGASNSQHLYGTAADLVSSGASLCQILYKARTSGFSGIIGPGSPDGDHEDHIHVDNRVQNNDDGIPNGYYWPYTRC